MVPVNFLLVSWMLCQVVNHYLHAGLNSSLMPLWIYGNLTSNMLGADWKEEKNMPISNYNFLIVTFQVYFISNSYEIASNLCGTSVQLISNIWFWLLCFVRWYYCKHIIKHRHFKVSAISVLDIYWISTIAWHLPICIGHAKTVSDFKNLKICVLEPYPF